MSLVERTEEDCLWTPALQIPLESHHGPEPSPTRSLACAARSTTSPTASPVQEHGGRDRGLGVHVIGLCQAATLASAKALQFSVCQCSIGAAGLW